MEKKLKNKHFWPFFIMEKRGKEVKNRSKTGKTGQKPVKTGY
jgi:hypothetical protein